MLSATDGRLLRSRSQRLEAVALGDVVAAALDEMRALGASESELASLACSLLDTPEAQDSLALAFEDAAPTERQTDR